MLPAAASCACSGSKSARRSLARSTLVASRRPRVDEGVMEGGGWRDDAREETRQACLERTPRGAREGRARSAAGELASRLPTASEYRVRRLRRSITRRGARRHPSGCFLRPVCETLRSCVAASQGMPATRCSHACGTSGPGAEATATPLLVPASGTYASSASYDAVPCHSCCLQRFEYLQSRPHTPHISFSQ